MCGRYVLYEEGNEELRELLDRTEGEYKTGEIFPTDKAPVLIQQGNIITPVAVSWGFPGFRGKGVIINARSETVSEKPMFRSCLEARRCIVPSSGFFEWSHDAEKKKYQFNLPGSGILYMAGLYGIFQGESRYVILTTAANQSMEKVHSRMPVVLDPNEKSQWLMEPSVVRKLLVTVPPRLIKVQA